MTEVLDPAQVRWVPTSVARQMLRVSKQRVYQLIETGALASCRVHGILLVSTISIDSRIKGHMEDKDYVR